MAYKKWCCSSNIPYFVQDKEVQACQAYCFDVENLCPFFRPVDTYGGQPVFLCRNVVQIYGNMNHQHETSAESK